MVRKKWILLVALALVGVLVLSACEEVLSEDTDGDGIPDLEEIGLGTDPEDPDSDDDGMPDGWEVDNSLDPTTDDASGDPDQDNLANVHEYQEGTDPNNDDSDGDSMPDDWEVGNKLDPTADDGSGDPDGDNLANAEEYQEGTDPHKADNVELVCALSGHDDVVRAVAFSPDGKLLASGAYNDTVRLWQVADWAPSHTLWGSGAVGIAFSPPTGQILASCYSPPHDGRGMWRLWRVADGTLTHEGDYGPPVSSLAFSPDGGLLALGLWTGPVQLWQLPSGVLLRTLSGHPRPVGGVAFSPDGKLVASGANNDTVRLWQVADGTLLRTLGPGSMNVDFSPDGTLLASGSHDQPVRLWQVADGTPLYTLGSRSSMDLDFSPDGDLLASCAANVVELWRVADGTLWRYFLTPVTVNCLAFSPDGMLLALGSFDGSVQVWRVWR
jgi:WD40 repeat protein